jgi:beta-galactosidase
MNDRSRKLLIRAVSNSFKSPWSVSRRAFIGMLGATGVVFAQERTAPLAKDVTGFLNDNNPVDLVPRLSPLPEAVVSVAQPCLDLNGTWRFNPNPAPDFWKDVSDSGWSGIKVPGEWAMQGFTVKPRQAAGYCLRFQAPADWAGQQVKLRFDAVYSKAEVWMNGTPVGSHLGAFTPFELDVTKAILPGKENLLALAVSSDSLSDALTVGLEMVGHPMGGIIRKVSLFAIPPVNISSLHVGTTFDREYRNATMRVFIDVINETPTKEPLPNSPFAQTPSIKDAEFTLSLREYGPSGKAVAITPSTVKMPALAVAEVVSQEIAIPVEAPKKWDAEHPNLYVLSCELKAGGHRYTTQRRFGFRQTEIKEGQVLLNGQPVRLRGMTREDTDPLTGRTISMEVHKKDIEWLKYANCNNTYTCAFLPDEELVNLCDEAGIYVLDEPGTCWLPGRSGFAGYDDPKALQYCLQPVLEMIERDRSHPSVITWMLSDETKVGKNFFEILKITRAIDPSRPVHIAYDPASGAEEVELEPVPSMFDFGSWHYPTKPMFEHAAQSKRPVLFDQSACPYFADLPELNCDPGMHEQWGREYALFWEKVWNTKSIFGAQVFNLNDDQYLHPSGLVSGNGDWGLVDPWRRAKPDLYHVRKAHSPVKVPDLPLSLPTASQPLEVPVENRYDFSNLSEVRIEWSLGDESGTVEADVAPHVKGIISIRPKSKDLNGKTLSLKFLRDNRLVDAYKLPIGEVAESAIAAKNHSGKRVELAQTDETITARGEGFEWLVSRHTGQIVKATRKGKPVLVGGPVLMVLPTKDYPMTPGFPDPRPQSSDILNTPCSDWKATSVSATQSAGAVEIVVAGEYKEAAGSYTIRIDGDGAANVSYRFTSTAAEKITVRQAGMVFYMPRRCDTLTWKRKALWSVYPEDHIGRPEGVAKALPDQSMVGKAGSWMEVAYRQKPSWPWFMDANALGSRDFRATRPNILRASLNDDTGNGITVLSDGSQHTRSFLDGNRIGLLVASYSGPAFNTSWLHGVADIAGLERRSLEAGGELKDVVHISLSDA